MYSGGIDVLFALGVINIIWLGVVTVWLWKNNTFLKRLFPGNGSSFRDKLDEVLAEVEDLENFKKQSLKHVQRIYLKRYNPYHDTGGDQSFSAAFLDGNGSGIVISSLHARTGTRVFAKPVKEGKEDRVQFSEEEKLVVKQALQPNKEIVNLE